MGKLKRRDIIIISVVAVVVLAVVITCCVLFCPRNLTGIVDTNGIQKIEVLNENNTVKTLSNDEVVEFCDIVKSSKYTNAYQSIKATNLNTFKITYKDSYIVLTEYRISICDSAGKTTVKNVNLNMTEFFKAFVG